MQIAKYSIGIGDRFGLQGAAQLQALKMAQSLGVEVAPVWNKSHREHTIIHSQPQDARAEADAAVLAQAWGGAYFVDADHIGVKNVDLFLDSCDFFTLDVAECIGQPADPAEVRAFVDKHSHLTGALTIPGIAAPFQIARPQVEAIAAKYLAAAQEAGRIYRRIEAAKGPGAFVTEVSMDETDAPQTPIELLFILAAIAGEKIPAQTIAPRFSGRFNKGLDYVGDVAQFAREFEDDLCVIAFAVREFNLPANLKLSIHSGSDKFSIYDPIRRAIRKHNAGLHLKTAGTTWLEELIGLASAGGEGLGIAREVYRGAFGRFDELCGPYASVIDIDTARLPSPQAVDAWSGPQFAAALRHDPASPAFNPHFRQLLHVGYKVAAEMGPRYLAALRDNAPLVAKNVTENIFDRHLKRIFID